MIIEDAFFTLRISDDGLPNGYASCHTGIFGDGEYIDLSKKEFAERHYNHARLTLEKPSPLPDLLFTIQEYCWSEKAHNLFVKNLNIWPAIDWVRVNAVDRNEKFVANYWLPKFYRHDAVKVLDLNHAEYTAYPPHPVLRPPGTIVVKDITRWVLSSHAIGGLDLFYGTHSRWFASPNARKLVEKHELRGFEFTPVAVWVPDEESN